jgi:hypothetical protein
VARAVDVRVVAVVRLVLDVRRGDGDAALLLLRSVVDLVERAGLTAVRVREDLGDGRRQGRLAMVDVTDGPDVDVRLVPLEISNRWKVLKIALCGIAAGQAETNSPVRSPTIFSAMLGGTSS